MAKYSKLELQRVLGWRRSSAASPQDRRHELTDEEAIEEQLEDKDDVPCGSEFCCGGNNAGTRD